MKNRFYFTKYECTVIQSTGALFVQLVKSEYNSLRNNVQIGIMSESTVIEPYGAIIVQSIPNFGISVWVYCSRTANPLASINSNG